MKINGSFKNLVNPIGFVKKTLIPSQLSNKIKGLIKKLNKISQ